MLGILSRIRFLIFITIVPQISTLGADSPSGVQPGLFLWLLLLLLILDRTIFSLYNSYRVQDSYDCIDFTLLIRIYLAIISCTKSLKISGSFALLVLKYHSIK